LLVVNNTSFIIGLKFENSDFEFDEIFELGEAEVKLDTYPKLRIFIVQNIDFFQVYNNILYGMRFAALFYIIDYRYIFYYRSSDCVGQEVVVIQETSF